jgi:hypothetical protein
MITITNSRQDGVKETCFLSQKEFETAQGISYHFGVYDVSPEMARRQPDIEFSKSFVLPGLVNDRHKLTEYLSALGLRGNKSYSKMYAQLAEGLPLGKDENFGKNFNEGNPLK